MLNTLRNAKHIELSECSHAEHMRNTLLQAEHFGQVALLQAELVGQNTPLVFSIFAGSGKLHTH